jgi:uncharacterized SAM-binding protein YcdF (DUF218 family)
MLITLAFLLLITAITWRIKPSRMIITLLICMDIFIFTTVSTGLIPEIMARNLAPTDANELQYTDSVAIILIGAGISESGDGKMTIPFYGYSRAVKTMTTYRSCVDQKAQCHIIVSGGTPPGSTASEASIYAKSLIEMGIPVTSISLEEQSKNTWENAKYTLASKSKTFDNIFVITNSLHTKRTSLYFKHFNKKVITLPSDSVPYRLNPMQWGVNWLIYDVCLHELIGLARYHIYQALGFNKSTEKF